MLLTVVAAIYRLCYFYLLGMERIRLFASRKHGQGFSTKKYRNLGGNPIEKTTRMTNKPTSVVTSLYISYP